MERIQIVVTIMGAVSFSIDGFIYNGSISRTSLSSYFASGDRIWPFEDVKACGAAYVKIIAEYAQWNNPELPGVVTSMLYQNYPNPFKAETTISCRVLSYSPVRIDIANILGQTVRTILNEPLESGTHTVAWDGRDETGRDLRSGAYFVRMHVGSDIITRKIMLVK